MKGDQKLSMLIFIEKALQRTDCMTLEPGVTDRGVAYPGVTLEEVQSEIRRLRKEAEQSMCDTIIKNPKNILGRFTMDTDLNLHEDDYIATKGQECTITKMRSNKCDIIVMDGDRIIRATVLSHCVEITK